jgi:hypothetical protein
MTRSYKLVALAALMAGGCGGGAQHAPRAAAPRSYTPASEAKADSSPQPQAAGAPAEAESRSTPTPEQRPGLGTVWGEDRASRVSEVNFTRRTPDQPFATVSLNYNDRAGVAAMAAQSGRSDYADNVLPIFTSQIRVRLLDERGMPLPSTRAGGRTYVVGEHGQRYLIQVQNDTGNRFEVVTTVDGLDVLDGRPGSYSKNGYVLGPYATLQIDGYRQSLDTVATFRFGSVADSYAEKQGDGRNVGVIGVALFDEPGSTWPWTDEEIRRRHDADPFPGRFAEPPRY